MTYNSRLTRVFPRTNVANRPGLPSENSRERIRALSLVLISKAGERSVKREGEMMMTDIY